MTIKKSHLQSSSQTTIYNLPFEILVSIFIILPVPQIFRIQNTCKRFREVGKSADVLSGIIMDDYPLTKFIESNEGTKFFSWEIRFNFGDLQFSANARRVIWATSKTTRNTARLELRKMALQKKHLGAIYTYFIVAVKQNDISSLQEAMSMVTEQFEHGVTLQIFRTVAERVKRLHNQAWNNINLRTHHTYNCSIHKMPWFPPHDDETKIIICPHCRFTYLVRYYEL